MKENVCYYLKIILVRRMLLIEFSAITRYLEHLIQFTEVMTHLLKTGQRSNSSDAALNVTQHAIAALVNWANTLPASCVPSRNEASDRSMDLLKWDNAEIGELRLLFDSVKLPEGQGASGKYYCPVAAIANTDPAIPYPVASKPDLEAYKSEIQSTIPDIERNLGNLTFLSIVLEKYGSCLSFGESNVALVDLARITGAVAAGLANQPQATHLSLVAGDLSGIQDFIYTISSDGALKSLRARSFYLELVTEEVVQQLLEVLNLPRTSIIYAGGGNFSALPDLVC